MQKIAVLGLGYVGLPLAVEFAKKHTVLGFDINSERVNELNSGTDGTLEVADEMLQAVLSNGLTISAEPKDLEDIDIYIITVPTPVNRLNQPDLTPLIKASEMVGKYLSKDNIVIYESTVYPGVTEDECVPILEKVSNLKFNIDFYCGYSPERINPGDKVHTLTSIKKVTSGSTPEMAKKIDDLYASIITAGTHSAPSIKVAESAKVIENSQRDINIAFVNELSKIFAKLGIDTTSVLEAAGTKWNFLKFTPGLVGGHCIGVDPFYLAQKAQEAGYLPEIILAGRRLNDSMGQFVAAEVVKLLIKNRINMVTAKVLILGFTFKENCPDIRNTKVIDVYKELQDYGISTDVFEPWASPGEIMDEYGIKILDEAPAKGKYDAVIHAVAHKEFKGRDLREYCQENGVVYDVKSTLPLDMVDKRL